ncbi:hypothetical protein EDB85DRAFT_316506 [Lactarius pseudohatsudake]|nr:hypothetical protein EDB85DRAFT_316506 [Lactarius pseudohatsudake]
MARPCHTHTRELGQDKSKTWATSSLKFTQLGVSTSGIGSSTHGPEPFLARSRLPTLLQYSLRPVREQYWIGRYAPVPTVALMQPATGPPIPADQRLVLRPPKLPWPVAHHRITVGQVGSLPSFFIGKNGRQRKGDDLGGADGALRDAHDAHDLRDPQGVSHAW